MQRESGLSRRRVAAAGNLLQRVGARGGPEAAVQRAVEFAKQQRQLEQSRLEMMRGYAETSGCRRHYLLGYFGQASGPVCGNCDNCRTGSAQRDSSPSSGPFPVGATIRHREGGEGTVLQVEQDRITVLFASAGYRTLSLEAVQEQHLAEKVADHPQPPDPSRGRRSG
ncbi:RecQ family zinc-binding domain-containing protein [Actinocrinis sp.]|uniref:RecQ family zinc-binding domain-containing protein n=1 Tax=Actinocrinis sp. TaxID=1920516 RepID=UPI002D386D75|nr:RecQ family zinc-binding domain-containing protein [Actinocrinis sp.]HZP52923.1 RecQ family zinc-binding domain-containing protein [Actinocrinis sp.]